MLMQSRLIPVALATALLGPWALASAQQQSDQDAAPAIEPEALAALDKMGKFLITLESFEVHADTTIDEVLVDNGQKIQLASSVDYKVKRPDHMFVDVASDRKHRQYFYDGKTVTVYAPEMKYYAIFQAPATIRETLDAAEEKFELNMPLRDLFVWGTDEADPGALTGALNIGPATISGELCDHYAYRQDDVDWQLWLRRDGDPLPCKLVITTTSEESHPQYSATLSWKLAASFDDSAFTFTAPEGASQIVMAEESAAEGESKN
jgi:hypothetical protein